MDQPLDGSVTVIFQPTRGKSAKQRGLQHLWYRDVVNSGVGGKYEEDEDILDVYCKYRWGIAIATQSDEYLAELFIYYSRKYGKDPDRMMWWTREHIHTEKFTVTEMATFLTQIQRWYGIRHGVNLTDPDAYGWKGLLEMTDERI